MAPRRLLHRYNWLVLWCGVLLVSPGSAHAQTSAGAPPRAFTFDEVLQFATEHYPTVRAAIERVTAANADVSVSRSASLPRLDAIWQTNRATTNNVFGQLLPQSVLPSLSGPVLDATSMHGVWGSAAGALLSWEPVDFGLRDAAVHESEAALARAQADESLTRLTAQTVVGNAFLDVLAAQQAVTAAESDVQRREVLAGAVHTLVDNQLRAGAEASRSDAELAAARTRLIQARQTFAIAEVNLARWLGLPDARVTAVAGPWLAAPAADASPAPASFIHPMLAVSEASVEQARAREAVLSKTDRPRLLLQTSLFGRGSGANLDGTVDEGAGGLGLERANWAAGLQIVFPNVFDFSALKSRKAAASALTRAETARSQETRLALTAEERTAAIRLESARAIAQNTPVQLTAARQGETQARARYDAGLAGIVEVAEAQSLLAAAEYQDAVARVQVWRAMLALAAVRGDVQAFSALVRGVR